MLIATVHIGICKAECSCLIGPRQHLRASGRLPLRSCRKPFACHRRRFDHPPCPHRRILTLRRQSRLYISAESPSLGADGSVSALTVSASTLRLRYADGVSPHASGSCEAGMNGTGAVQGGPGKPGKVLREAHPSIPIPQRLSTVAAFLQPSLSASSAVRRAARLISRPSSSASPETQLASTRTK